MTASERDQHNGPPVALLPHRHGHAAVLARYRGNPPRASDLRSAAAA